jgi:hypothetical protein
MNHEKLFVVHSPYHILLSYAIAAESEAKSHIFVQPYSTEDEIGPLVDMIERTGVFDSHTMVTSIYDTPDVQKEKVTRLRLSSRHTSQIAELINRTEVDEVCCSLDDRDVDQAAIHFARDKNPQTVCSLIEDGMGAYTDGHTYWHPYPLPRLHWLYHYLRFGYRYEKITYYGQKDEISRIYCLHEELLRDEYEAFEKVTPSADPLQDLGETIVLQEYFDTIGLDRRHLDEIDVLVLFPKVSNFNNDATEIFNEIIYDIERAGLRVGIKPHPRQKNTQELTDIGTQPVLLPQAIPAELLLVAAGSSLSAIIGELSTFLYSAKWIDKEVKVFTVYPMLQERGIVDDPPQRAKDMLTEVGVVTVNNRAELPIGPN